MSSRSFLFVPGHKPERFDKAFASGAHEVVLDLEDAVAPALKAEARACVGARLEGEQPTFVRVNAIDTEWHVDDLRLLQRSGYAGLMLPKADAQSVASVAASLPGHRIIALLETVAGYMDLERMVRIPGLERIAFGSVDFEADSGITDEHGALDSVRVAIVLQSRYAGLKSPIDGVSVDFKDEQRMRTDALQSRRFGFGGKLCIHPNQVAPINNAYLPSEEQLQWAQRVVEAFKVSAGAATTVNSKMIDKPVVEQALRVLAAR